MFDPGTWNSREEETARPVGTGSYVVPGGLSFNFSSIGSPGTTKDPGRGRVFLTSWPILPEDLLLKEKMRFLGPQEE